MHRMPYLYRSLSTKEPYFLLKSPVIGGSFAERDLQLEATYVSLPTCMSSKPFDTINTLQKSLIMGGFFAERDLQFEASYVSLPSCMSTEPFNTINNPEGS